MNNGFVAAVALTAGVFVVASADAKTGGWTTADYIQNGLVVQFDGIDNAGTGVVQVGPTGLILLVR